MIEQQAAPEYTKADLEKMGAKWLERIRLSEKREDDWAKNAEAAEHAFLAGCDDGQGETPGATWICSRAAQVGRLYQPRHIIGLFDLPSQDRYPFPPYPASRDGGKNRRNSSRGEKGRRVQ